MPYPCIQWHSHKRDRKGIMDKSQYRRRRRTCREMYATLTNQSILFWSHGMGGRHSCSIHFHVKLINANLRCYSISLLYSPFPWTPTPHPLTSREFQGLSLFIKTIAIHIHIRTFPVTVQDFSVFPFDILLLKETFPLTSHRHNHYNILCFSINSIVVVVGNFHSLFLAICCHCCLVVVVIFLLSPKRIFFFFSGVSET